MSDTTTLIQRLRDMAAEHCGGSLYDRETSKTLDATIRTIEELEAHAKWHQEQCQMLQARCDSFTARARVAEAEAKALRQKCQEKEDAEKQIERLTFALERIRDIDWSQYSNRIDAIQQLAKETLNFATPAPLVSGEQGPGSGR